MTAGTSSPLRDGRPNGCNLSLRLARFWQPRLRGSRNKLSEAVLRAAQGFLKARPRWRGDRSLCQPVAPLGSRGRAGRDTAVGQRPTG